MGIPSGRPPQRPLSIKPFDRAILEAKADKKIYGTEAAKIIRLAKEGGLSSRERALLESLSRDTFSTPLSRRLFAEALERKPPKSLPNVK